MADLITQVISGRLFKNTDVPFEQCHASSLVQLSNNTILVTFFAGTKEGAKDTSIWLVRGNGGHWQQPEKIIDTPNTALWNPVLHTYDDVIGLFFKVGDNVQTWTTQYSISTDEGISWSLPRELIPGSKHPFGPVKNKLITLENGDWLAPNSIEKGEMWDAYVDRSNDQGKSWSQSSVPFHHQIGTRETEVNNLWNGLTSGQLWETKPETIFQWDGVIQPSLWVSSNHQVHMLLRSTRGKIYRSDSDDGGKTWCCAYPTELPNNNSGLDLTQSPAGIFLVFNPVSGNWGARYPLSISHSYNNGENWQHLVDLEVSKGEYSYPAIICSKNELHITYTSNRETIIYQKWEINESLSNL